MALLSGVSSAFLSISKRQSDKKLANQNLFLKVESLTAVDFETSIIACSSQDCMKGKGSADSTEGANEFNQIRSDIDQCLVLTQSLVQNLVESR